MGRHTHRLVEFRTGSALTAVLWACVLVLPGCSEGATPAPGPHLVYTRLAVDLLQDPPRWQSEAHVPGRPPRVEVACPSRDQVSDSGDQLALILPAPGSVTFTVTEEEGPVFLRSSMGVDLALARTLSRGMAALEVTFEIDVNGKRVATRQVGVRSSDAQSEVMNQTSYNSWVRLGPREVALVAGDQVRLSTRLPAGAPPTLPEVPAAFGSLRLEREFSRPRTLASTDRPNLVLVVMDTERSDRTQPYGYGRPTTPHLAELAKRGLTFEQAYSTSSWTWPATASMLTGLAPTAHGIRVHQNGFLAHELETLGEALQDVGFTTAAFVANPLVSETHNYSQGFEHFFGTPKMVKGDGIVPQAVQWLEENSDRRFFLYLHLADPHTPHLPSPEELLEFTGYQEAPFPSTALVTQSFIFKRALPPGPDGLPQAERLLREDEAPWYSDVYDAGVHQGDRALGELLAALKRLGHLGDTVIAYTSDHGEELLDHKSLGHGHELWEELVRVPLILAGPGLPQGRRLQVPVSNRHLGPTLARLGGTELRAPSDAQFLASGRDPAARPIFFETHEGWWKGSTATLYGVRRGKWVLHWGLDGGQAENSAAPQGGEVRLFDLSQDRGQRNNVAGAEAELVEELKTLISTELQRLQAQAPRQKSRTGWGTQALLEAMGYASGDD